MNRRSFIQRCFAGLGGAVVAFMPGKKRLGYREATKKEPQTFNKKDIDNIWVSAERNPICPICDREMYLSLISKFPNTCFYKCEKSPHYWTYDKELFLSDLRINREKILLLS